jgi:heme/copper-type cytochrome/quinol oxidase subunit 3
MQYMQQHRLTSEDKAERDRKRAERDAAMRDRNNRLGLNIFQGSWIMAFVSLVVVNWQLGFSTEWVAEGAQLPDATMPTIATISLFISTFLARSAKKAIESSNRDDFIWQWPLAIGLGTAFFGIMLTQFYAVEPGDGQFVFVYRLMIGYHALHAVVIGLMMAQVYRYALAGRYSADNHWPIEATMKLWYFVTIAWVMFYVVLYLI